MEGDGEGQLHEHEAHGHGHEGHGLQSQRGLGVVVQAVTQEEVRHQTGQLVFGMGK